MQRNGADFAVFINTGVEYDGSDSGASPDEAVSWGKIKKEAKPVKVLKVFLLRYPNRINVNNDVLIFRRSMPMQR